MVSQQNKVFFLYIFSTQNLDGSGLNMFVYIHMQQ